MMNRTTRKVAVMGIGGSAKSTVAMCICWAATQLDVLTTCLDGSLNPDLMDRIIHMRWMLTNAPTLDSDTWPVQWVTDPATKFQLVPGSASFSRRALGRRSADLRRALARAEGQRDLVVVDFDRIDPGSEGEVFDLTGDVLEVCTDLVLVADQNAKSWSSPEEFLQYLDRRAEPTGRGVNRSRVHMVFSAGAPEAGRVELAEARKLAERHKIGWLGDVPYVPALFKANNQGDVLSGLSNDAKQHSLEFTARLLGIELPAPPKRRWRGGGRVGETKLGSDAPAGMLTYGPSFRPLPPPQLPSPTGLPAPAWPAPQVSRSVPEAPASSGPVGTLERVAIGARLRRPAVLLQAFADPVIVGEMADLSVLHTQLMFALDSYEGRRQPATLAEMLGVKVRSVKAAGVELAHRRLIDEAAGSWLLPPAVRSIGRWIRDLALVVSDEADAAARLIAASALLAELEAVQAPAFGGNPASREWGWAFRRPDGMVVAAADRAIGGLAMGCHALADACRELRAAGDEAPENARVVLALLRIVGLCPPEAGWPIVAAASALAGDSAGLRRMVRDCAAQLTAAGFTPPLGALDDGVAWVVEEHTAPIPTTPGTVPAAAAAGVAPPPPPTVTAASRATDSGHRVMLRVFDASRVSGATLSQAVSVPFVVAAAQRPIRPDEVAMLSGYSVKTLSSTFTSAHPIVERGEGWLMLRDGVFTDHGWIAHCVRRAATAIVDGPTRESTEWLRLALTECEQVTAGAFAKPAFDGKNWAWVDEFPGEGTSSARSAAEQELIEAFLAAVELWQVSGGEEIYPTASVVDACCRLAGAMPFARVVRQLRQSPAGDAAEALLAAGAAVAASSSDRALTKLVHDTARRLVAAGLIVDEAALADRLGITDG